MSTVGVTASNAGAIYVHKFIYSITHNYTYYIYICVCVCVCVLYMHNREGRLCQYHKINTLNPYKMRSVTLHKTSDIYHKHTYFWQDS